MKKRILISQVTALVMLIIAKPDDWRFFLAGLILFILGQAVRLLSSACIVKSKTLTTNGPYAAARNPLYLGTFIMTLGFILTLSSPNDLARTIIVWLFAIVAFSWIYRKTILSEEEFLLKTYGEQYSNYKKTVNSIVPKIGSFHNFFDSTVYSMETFKKNKEWRGMTAMIALIVFVAARIYYGF
ncbi:MAG: isoprenylcysteine carboxylmethyltransferase family protein [Elusimicrobiales bacterium]|nr:isoprenylcysteine carboxylmethyltransferase family protein [Elusimicrobiales bacterium]